MSIKKRLKESIEMNNGIGSWDKYIGSQLESDIVSFIERELKNHIGLSNGSQQSEQLPQNFCTLNQQTCGKGSGCKYPHCHL